MRILSAFLRAKKTLGDKFSVFNTANSVPIFFIALFVGSIAILLSFNVSYTPTHAPTQQMPKIELYNFTAYEIDDKALLTKLSAKNGKQFELPNKSTIEELSDVLVERNSEAFDTLQARKARKVGNDIYFDEGVKNVRDGYEIYSDIAIYNLQNKGIKGRDNFYIKSAFEDIKGKNISYENGFIKAQDIKAKIKLAKKSERKK